MINNFKNHLKKNFSFLENKRIFLAVSGGIDSMVLLHLFQQLDYEFAVLHCNFKLRGKESDGDMQFVHDYAESFDIPWSFGHFETKAFAKENKISIQMAARELRYDWFEEQLIEKQFDYVLTAHHADDVLETFIINLSRGTGLEGLTGISEVNDTIIRTMLPYSRQEIEGYANANNLKWREDSSNNEDKYLRNNIRHNIIPELKKLNPNFLNSFQATLKNLNHSNLMAFDAASFVFNNSAIIKGSIIKYKIKKIKEIPHYEAYLHFWLAPFGFFAWQDIYDLVDAQSGKQVLSKEFRLLKDRKKLILAPKNEPVTSKSYSIKKEQLEVKKPIKLSFCKVSDISPSSNATIFVDENVLTYPLILRKWETGDKFQPFGMSGKEKKVSKFLKDEKIDLFEKETIWVLCSNEKIVWVVGMRADERFRTTNTTTNILQITLLL